MLDSKPLWQLQGAAIILFHIVAILFILFSGYGFDHPLSLIWLAIMIIHVGEIFIARIALKDKPVPPGVLVFKTLIFGFIWWLPRSRGVYTS